VEITSREELVGALTEAAELEHGLLCQYVFAAVSLKQTVDEGITWPQTELVRGWKRTLLEVARQEMAHLGTVCNLLTAIGGPPRLGRPNFPQPARYFTDLPFVLEPFSESTLRRFIRFEEPVTPDAREALIAPAPVTYRHVGELYQDIAEGLAALDDGTLFIGPIADQDDNDWSRGLHLWPVRDLASGRAAIDFIVLEGEGAAGHREGSHYERFIEAHRALLQELDADPDFAPGRPVAANPLTRAHHDAPAGGSLIEDPRTLPIAELFAVAYETTLMMLGQFYSFGAETPGQREQLRQATREMMSGVIRPLAEVLTRLPMGEHLPGHTAGPGFEVYGTEQISPHTENAWFVISERLARHGRQGLELAEVSDAPPRLRLCAENSARVGDNLTRAAASGFTTPSPALARRTLLAAAEPASEGRIHPSRTATARYGTAASAGSPDA